MEAIKLLAYFHQQTRKSWSEVLSSQHLCGLSFRCQNHQISSFYNDMPQPLILCFTITLKGIRNETRIFFPILASMLSLLLVVRTFKCISSAHAYFTDIYHGHFVTGYTFRELDHRQNIGK